MDKTSFKNKKEKFYNGLNSDIRNSQVLSRDFNHTVVTDADQQGIGTFLTI
jgi:hypothetical protein